MKLSTIVVISVVLLVFLFGCTTEEHKPLPNKPPKTYFWIFPDSMIREGHSRQQIHWWGQDPDGVIKGYLFAIGKFLDSSHRIAVPDTISWCFTTKTDSTVAFPLLTKRDTFDIAIRAVDNTFKFPVIPDGDTTTFENAIVRLSPFPYWDKNANGVLDGNDEELKSLTGAYDATGATQPMPLRNQPPEIFFAFDPNTQTDVFQQPETTFTVATFSWYGSDPDGDPTIAKYVIALNDTSDPAQRLILPSNFKLVTFVVPRSVSDTAIGSTVQADVYTGTFRTPPTKRGTIGGLKLNAYNRFYVQAIDVAGDSSHYIGMPTGTAKWYVKKPTGRLLIISDYVGSDTAAVLSFYKNMFPQVGTGQFASFDVFNIAKGLSLDDKKKLKVGRNVPPFFDPALIFTLHLYDVVFCYTDFNPSLYVVQIPFYEYVHNATTPGKIIYSYSMPFDTTANASRALEEFAPLDSVSRVDLISPGLLYPLPGTNQVPGGSFAYNVYADSSTTDYYPNLKFNSSRSTHLIYVRQVYKRSDARYIYHMQTDIRNPKRYAYGLSLLEFRAVNAIGTNAWTCGVNGMMYHTSDNGQTWESQQSNTGYTLNAIQFTDVNNGWAFGAVGTVLRTTDGGSYWSDNSMVTIANFNGVHFVNPSVGYVVGSYGSIMKTSDGGSTWHTQPCPHQRALYNVRFLDQHRGIIVGDSTALSTADGGTTWTSISGFTTRSYYSVDFSGTTTAFTVGARGSVMKLTTTDNGNSWIATALSPALGTGNELRSIGFPDSSNGWITAKGGLVYKTVNGGTTWTSIPSTGVTQNLLSSSFTNATTGWCVGTTGLILRTDNGGTTWATQPSGLLNVGVIDGQKSFVFLGLPLHLLDGNATVKNFLDHVLFQEFGLR